MGYNGSSTPAKGVGRDERRESSNLSFSAKIAWKQQKQAVSRLFLFIFHKDFHKKLQKIGKIFIFSPVR